MSASFVLILVVVGSYLAAHVLFSWLARRYNVISGAEYLLLGILLGPQISGLISTSVVGGFAPFLTLALGWVGVLVGAQFYLPELLRIRAKLYRIAFMEAVVSFCAVAAVMALVIQLWLGRQWSEAWLPAAVLGAMAAASSPTGVAVVARRLGRFGPVVRQLQLTTAIDALLAITAFSILLALDHVPPASGVRPPTATEWVVISVAIGCVGGALFHLFLGEEQKIDRLFIALAGAVILASGAAAYLRLSPLLPSMLIGMILVNTSSSRVEIRQVLTTVERPIYYLLLIFAGAAWRPSAEAWLLPVLAYLVARWAFKVGGAAASGWANGATTQLGFAWGRGLVGQGALALAIALNYQIHERSLLSNMVFTAAIVSVLLTDLTSARAVEAVVDDARARLLRRARQAAQLGGR